MKKVLSCVMAIMLFAVAVLAVSCGSTPVSTTATAGTAATAATTAQASTEATAATEATEATAAPGYGRPDAYLDVDFGGKKFVFATGEDGGWSTTDEVAVESREGGTVVDTAIYDRNAIMKKLYNCTIEAVVGSSALIANDITTGTSTVDFATVQYSAFNANSSQYYVNVLTMGLDFDLPGWNMDYIDQCSTVDNNGVRRMYGLDGDFGISGINAIWVMVVNLDLFEDNFSDDIFELVESKEWTIDKMEEYCAAIQQDNGNQEWNVGEDVYGLVSTIHNSTGLITGLGLQFVQKDANGKLYCDKEKTVLAGNAVAAIDKICSLYSLDGVDCETPYTQVAQTLGNGKSLFIGQVFAVVSDTTDSESGTYGLSNFDANYSPIPEPLYQAGDDYRSYVNNKFSTYYVSKNTCNGDVSIAADFLNLYAYHSYYLVRPAMLKLMGEICCNDSRAASMVDIIMDSRVYDYAYYASAFYGELHTDMTKNVNNLAKMANKNARNTQSLIDNYIAAISKNTD